MAKPSNTSAKGIKGGDGADKHPRPAATKTGEGRTAGRSPARPAGKMGGTSGKMC